MLERLYATRIPTRNATQTIRTAEIALRVYCGKDSLRDYIIESEHVIALVVCDATSYHYFQKNYGFNNDSIEFDYFNLNKIEE